MQDDSEPPVDTYGHSVRISREDVENSDNIHLKGLWDVNESARVNSSKFMYVNPPLVIHETLTSEEVAKLQTAYPQLNLQFCAQNNNSHGFAAAMRKIELQKLFHYFDFDPQNYRSDDTRVIDIGGNYFNGVAKQYRGMHYCSPIMDVVDANRCTNRLNLLSNMVVNSVNNPDKKLTSLQVEYIEQVQSVFASQTGGRSYSKFVCKNKVQDCKHRAPYAIMLHSAYDIPIQELLTACDSRGIRTVVGTMMFDPLMWYMEAGYISYLDVDWEIYHCNRYKGKRIRFTFRGSSSISYDHDYLTYMSYFSCNELFSKNGTRYVIEWLEREFGIQFFRINRIEHGVNLQMSPVSTVHNANIKDYYVMTYKICNLEEISEMTKRSKDRVTSEFANNGTRLHEQSTSYDNLMQDARRMIESEGFFELCFTAHKELVDSVISFTLGASEKKFTLTECYNYARSKTYVLTVGKEVIHLGQKVDPRWLYTFAEVCYLYCWAFKYNHGKNVQVMMDKIIDNRSLAGAHAYFGLPCLKSLWYKFSTVMKRVNVKLYDFAKSPGYQCSDMLRTLEDHINTGNCRRDMYNHIRSKLFPASKEHRVMIPELSMFYNDIEMFNDMMSRLNIKTRILKPDVNRTQLFTPSIDLSIRKLFPDIMVNLMSASSSDKAIKTYIQSLGAVDLVIPILDVNIQHAFIHKIMRLFKVQDISLLNDEMLLQFGDVAMPYEHYLNQIGIYRYSFRKASSHLISVTRQCDGQGLDALMFVNELQDIKKNEIKSSVPSSNVSNAAMKLDDLNCHFGGDLVKMLPSTTFVDLCSGPGAMSKFVIDFNGSRFNTTITGCRALSCSYPNNGQMTDVYDHPARRRFEYHDLEDFNIVSSACQNRFIDFVNKNKSDRGVELVVADGGIDGSYPNQEEESIGLILSEIQIALNILERGGRFVLKVYMGETLEMIQIVSRLSTYFKTAVLIKPEHSNLANGELYFVGLDYSGTTNLHDFREVHNGYYIGLQNFVRQFNMQRYQYCYRQLNGRSCDFSKHVKLHKIELDYVIRRQKEEFSDLMRSTWHYVSSKCVGIKSFCGAKARGYDRQQDVESVSDCEFQSARLEFDFNDGARLLDSELPVYVDDPDDFVDAVAESELTDNAGDDLPHPASLESDCSAAEEITTVTGSECVGLISTLPDKLSLSMLNAPAANPIVSAMCDDFRLYKSLSFLFSQKDMLRLFMRLYTVTPRLKEATCFPKSSGSVSRCLALQAQSTRTDRVSMNIEQVFKVESSDYYDAEEDHIVEAPIVVKPKVDVKQVTRMKIIPKRQPVRYEDSSTSVEVSSSQERNSFKPSTETLTSLQTTSVNTVEVVVPPVKHQVSVSECESKSSDKLPGGRPSLSADNGSGGHLVSNLGSSFNVDGYGKQFKVSCHTYIPDLRVVCVPGDGDCFFHAIGRCLFKVDELKQRMLDYLKKFNFRFELVPKDNMTECIEVLQTPKAWGVDYMARIYAHMMSVNITIVNLEYCQQPITYGYDSGLPTVYVIYRNQHFDFAVPSDSIYPFSEASPVQMSLNLPKDICVDPYVSAYELKNYSGVVLHVGSLVGVFSGDHYNIRSIEIHPGSYPFVLVNYSVGKSNIVDQSKRSLTELLAKLSTHCNICDTCQKGTTPLRWTHFQTDPVVMTACSRVRTVNINLNDHVDVKIKFKKNPLPVRGTIWNVGFEDGYYIFPEYDEFTIDEEFFLRLTKNTLSTITGPKRSVCIYSNITSRFVHVLVECLTGLFDSTYHVPVANMDTTGQGFSYEYKVGRDCGSFLYNSAVEIRSAWKAAVKSVMDKCRDQYNEVCSAIQLTTFQLQDTSSRVFSLKSRSWLIATDKEYAYGYVCNERTKADEIISLKDFYDVKTRDMFIKELIKRNVEFILVNKATEVFLEPVLYATVKDHLLTTTVLSQIKIRMVRGVPGAGKTGYILGSLVASDKNPLEEVVLTATRNAAEDLRKRIDPSGSYAKSRSHPYMSKFATVESALVNYKKYGRSVKRIYFDEAFLKHLGALVWSAVLLGAEEMILVGDEAQIPYSDRNGFNIRFASSTLLMSALPDKDVELLTVSRRIPCDVAYLLNNVLKYTDSSGRAVRPYKADVRTCNPKYNSLSASKLSNGVVEVPDGFDHYLVFSQSEKSMLVSARPKFKVNTIHEYQGQQASRVAIVRLLTASMVLFESQHHMLTAITRHTEECCYYTVVEDTLYKFINLLNGANTKVYYTNLPNSGGGYVFNSSRDREAYLKRANPRLIGTDMLPEHELTFIPDYAVSHKNEDGTLVKLVSQNDGTGFRGHYVGVREKPYYKLQRDDPIPVDVQYGDFINVLQYYMDEIRPGSSLRPNRLLMENFENSDLRVDCRNFIIAPERELRRPLDKMTPAVRTSCLPPFNKTQKAVLKGFNERNGVVCQYQTAVSSSVILNQTMQRFYKCYFKTGACELMHEYRKSPLMVNVDALTQWLNAQPPSVYEELKAADTHSLLDHITNKYNYMLKNVSKPKLDDNPQRDFSSPQCIAYLNKVTNAIYCPVIQELKRRLQYLLKPNKILFTDMSVESFEEVLTDRFGYDKLMKVKRKFENDFSKYDKSQGLDTLLFEANLLKSMGMSETLVKLWILHHKLSILIARDVRFKALVEYQRKSGDAMTFLGNTLWLMYMTMMLMGVDIVGESFSLFGGDDSLMFVFEDVDLDMASMFAKSYSMFNMEMKLIDKWSFYFCSRFLIFNQTDKHWYVVPDPLKALIKLGRSDLVNSQHVNEYRISLRDNWVNYSNQLLHPLINFSFQERYEYCNSISPLLVALWSVVQHRQWFDELYYWHDDDEEPEYTFLPNLDL